MTVAVAEKADEYTPFEDLLTDREFWAAFQEILLTKLTPRFVNIYLAGAQAGLKIRPKPKQKAGPGTITRIDSTRTLLAVANNAVDDYMEPLVKGISATTNAAIKDAVNQARAEGSGVHGVLTRISPLFDEGRAKRIAITETTRLFGLGAQAVYRVQQVPSWQWSTCNDPWVCEDCAAKEDEVYSMNVEFEPEHPGCRCGPRPSMEPAPGEEMGGEEFDPFAQEERMIDDIQEGDPEVGISSEFPTAWQQLENWALENNINLYFSQTQQALTPFLDTRLRPGIIRARQIATGITQARRALTAVGQKEVIDRLYFEINSRSAFDHADTSADVFRRIPTAGPNKGKVTGIVRINVDAEVWGPNGKAFCDSVVQQDWWVKGTGPSEVIVHEAGHVAQRTIEHTTYINWIDTFMSNLPKNVRRNLGLTDLPLDALGMGEAITGEDILNGLHKIAAKVSGYATKNPHEFVAETFEGLFSGNTYPDDVMILYRFLGGAEVTK